MMQGTEEWKLARIGKITASRLNDVMATTKTGGEAASRRNYRSELVVETLTGCPCDSYTSGPMQRGTELEPFARECYEFKTGNTVELAGFVDHPTIPMFGASPDGLVGDSGLTEIKCPNTANHIDWMLTGVVPPEHINQIQGQLDCTCRQWCDFISYDPRMPVDLQLFIVRVERDEARILKIREAVEFLRLQVSQVLGKLADRR